MVGRNDPCPCGSGKKFKKCCFSKGGQQMSFEDRAALYKKQYNILLKTDEQIDGIRTSCQLAAKMLDEACKISKAGVTTNEINDFIVKMHKGAGAIPAPLNYGSPPFPKAICTSLNEVVCHGIPDDTPLKDGDIMNIDITCILNGYYGDTSRMVMIGDVDEESKRVVETAYDALMASIDIVKPGLLLYEIGDVIESVAAKTKCGVVHQFVGHGVGVNFHEGPQVNHNSNRNRTPLEAGMTFTIEPMINAGVADCEIDSRDGWTARTLDRRASAQWEHTILVTESGHEILTLVP